MNLKATLPCLLCLVILSTTAAPANQNNSELPIDDLKHQEEAISMSPVVEPPTNDLINPHVLRILPTHPPTEQIPGPLPELEDDLTPDDYIPSYDCDGSVMCDAMSLAWCDDVVNFYLTRTDSAYYGTTANETRRGACTGWGSIGCAVFIQGNDDPKCTRTGNQMWWDYQDIRKQGQCWSCGTKHWYPGCMTTIGYVSWCKSDLLEHNLD